MPVRKTEQLWVEYVPATRMPAQKKVTLGRACLGGRAAELTVVARFGGGPSSGDPTQRSPHRLSRID